MQRYEVQILDGYQNPTYADGTVGAIYGWKPPLVNPSRPPGEWQTYDIVFERPRFGIRRQAAAARSYVTAFLNGVLVQNRQPWLGTTIWRKVATYQAHGDPRRSRCRIMIRRYRSATSGCAPARGSGEPRLRG